MGRQPGSNVILMRSYPKFVFLKLKPNSLTFKLNRRGKIVKLGHESATAVCCDVENEEWSEVPFAVTENRHRFSCIVVPKI